MSCQPPKSRPAWQHFQFIQLLFLLWEVMHIFKTLNMILLLALSLLLPLTHQAPATSASATTSTSVRLITTTPPSPSTRKDAPTQKGAPPNCPLWYIAVPGDGCDLIQKAFDLNPFDFQIWNPQVRDCWKDILVGYKYCVQEPVSYHGIPMNVADRTASTTLLSRTYTYDWATDCWNPAAHRPCSSRPPPTSKPTTTTSSHGRLEDRPGVPSPSSEESTIEVTSTTYITPKVPVTPVTVIVKTTTTLPPGR
ncbi:hypothetical protein GE09DRAFT_1285180 [Coniochaeta sp. 2T2.1]|nr:hypothetical protein GE09DRAFT_1285180 [Coniochaeta sp. 2T2.1]